jgi:hypothetical protein
MGIGVVEIGENRWWFLRSTTSRFTFSLGATGGLSLVRSMVGELSLSLSSSPSSSLFESESESVIGAEDDDAGSLGGGGGGGTVAVCSRTIRNIYIKEYGYTNFSLSSGFKLRKNLWLSSDVHAEHVDWVVNLAINK